MKKILLFILRVGLAVGIVGYLVVAHRKDFVDGIRALNCVYLIPAALIYAGHLCVGAWRWRRLARIAAVELSFFESLSLSMKALFFSLVIPGGAVGGDLAKAAFLSARTPAGRRTVGVMTILMDRIVGMAAMFVLILVLLVFAWPLLMRVTLSGRELESVTKIIGIAAVAGACVAGLAATVMLFFHRRLAAVAPIGFLMRKGDRWTHGLITRMTETIDCYSRAWRELTGLTVLSIFGVHLATVSSMYFIALGLGLRQFDALGLVTAGMVGNLAGLLPFTVAGVGMRDVTIVMILAAAGIGDGLAITIVYTSLIVFFDLLGGVFFILDADRGRAHANEEEFGNAGHA